MSEKKLLILNQQQIQQKLDRIAYQILEDNFDEEEILIAGILPRGDNIANRLKTILDGIAPFSTKLLTIELDKQSSSLQAKINFNVADCSGKVVILVDEYKKAGSYTIPFRAPRASSGSFFYRLTADSKGQLIQRTGQMIRMK